MALTAQEIYSKDFTTRSNKWYDKQEVNDFLKEVTKDYDNLLQDNAMLQTRLAEADSNVDQIEEMKQSVNSSILIAQEAADRLKKQTEAEAEATMQQAQAEAQKIVMEANAKANALITDSQNKNAKLVAEREALEKEMATFKARLEGMLKAQLDLVQTSDWQELGVASDAAETGVVADAATSDTTVETDSAAPVDASEVADALPESADEPDSSALAATQTVVIFPEDEV
jgi:cell division initiation protein